MERLLSLRVRSQYVDDVRDRVEYGSGDVGESHPLRRLVLGLRSREDVDCLCPHVVSPYGCEDELLRWDLSISARVQVHVCALVS